MSPGSGLPTILAALHGSTPCLAACARVVIEQEDLGLTGEEVGPSRREEIQETTCRGTSWLTKHAIPFGLHGNPKMDLVPILRGESEARERGSRWSQDSTSGI